MRLWILESSFNFQNPPGSNKVFHLGSTFVCTVPAAPHSNPSRQSWRPVVQTGSERWGETLSGSLGTASWHLILLCFQCWDRTRPPGCSTKALPPSYNPSPHSPGYVLYWHFVFLQSCLCVCVLYARECICVSGLPLLCAHVEISGSVVNVSCLTLLFFTSFLWDEVSLELTVSVLLAKQPALGVSTCLAHPLQHWGYRCSLPCLVFMWMLHI